MSNGRKPDFNVYTSPEQDSKSIPRQIGVGWFHSKGKGFNIVLEAFPIDGKCVAFEPKEKAETDNTQE